MVLVALGLGGLVGWCCLRSRPFAYGDSRPKFVRNLTFCNLSTINFDIRRENIAASHPQTRVHILPAFVTADQYAEAVGVSYATACRRLSHIAPNAPGKRKLSLACVLPTLRESERIAVPQLCASAEVLPHMYVGDVIAPTVHALERWLTPDQAARVFSCRIQFTNALATLSADFFLFHERLRMALVLNETVLFYVLGVTAADTLPDWSRFAPAFSICNAREEDLLNISYKEAA
jgi:hypothetical protein